MHRLLIGMQQCAVRARLPRCIKKAVNKRLGFTIVELLVVIFIVGALVALLVPAVQAAREAARRNQCSNHLKQVGLAFLSHEANLGIFPSGGYDWWTPPVFANGRPLTGAKQDAGWAFQILPYLEEGNAWQPPSNDDLECVLSAVAATPSVYFCPSRRGPMTLTYAEPSYLGGVEAVHGLIDYAASNFDGTGVVARQRCNRVAAIVDGTSRSLLAGDKRLNVRYLGEWQEDDNEGYTAGFDEDTMRVTTSPPEPDVIDEGTGNLRFGSSHAGTINALFADGSVRSISYEIDASVFAALGNISDGQPNNADGF